MKSTYKQVSLVVLIILLAIIIFEISCKQLGSGNDKKDDQKTFSIIGLFKTVSDTVSNSGNGGGGTDYKFPLDTEDYDSASKSVNGWLNYNYNSNKEYHTGIDIFPSPGDSNPNVYSVANGTIKTIVNSCAKDSKNGCNGGVGNKVFIEHDISGEKRYSVYYHLASVNECIVQGAIISQEDIIGKLGKTGSNDDNGGWIYSNHLHFELRKNLDNDFYGYGSDKTDIQKYYTDPTIIGDGSRSRGDSPFIYNIRPCKNTEFKRGDQIKIEWESRNIAATTKMKISLKRSSETGKIENANYKVLSTETDNSGSATFTIPNTLNDGDDWRIYLVDTDGNASFKSNIGYIKIKGGNQIINTEIYTVGGSLSGLTGTLVLQNNGGNDLSLTADGSFIFSTSIASGSAYNVTVKTNPVGQTCTVTNGSGNISSANVTNVSVTCSTIITSHTVGGSLSGINGTVVLQNNGGNDLSLTANGNFTFLTSIANGSAYSVTIKTNPSGQTCTVTNGIGNISSANVINVSVTCATILTSHTVGGSLSGINGTVVLQNNGGNDLQLTADGSFIFSTSIASGSAYSVTVKTNPVGQTCTVTNGSGNISSANVTNVSVTCSKSCGVVDVTDGTSKHIAKGLNGNIFIGGKNSTGFFISKINNNCQVVITKNITAPNSNYGNFHGIKLDSAGNIYIIGDIQCSNGINFEGTSCTGNSQDIFLVKYDSNFTKLFSKIFADTSVYEIGYGLEVDSIGNSYVYYNKGTTLYLVKYSSDGNSQVFNKNLQNECTGNSSFSYGDIFVSGSNIFLTGTTNCSTFNGVNNPNNINPTMKDNYFILKANSSDGVFTQTIMHPYSSGYEKRYYGLSIYAASNSAYISAWGYPSSTEGTIMFAKHDLSNGNLLWENFIFHGSSDKPSSIISSNNTFIVIGNTLGAYYDSYKPASRALYFHKYDLNGLVSKKLLSVPTDFDAQNAILDDQGFLNIVWKYQNKVKYGIFDTEGNLK